MTLITKISELSGILHTMDIPVDLDYYHNWTAMNYSDRPHVQDAFPHLSAEHREFLLTGITPEEWDEAFPDEEIVDDYDSMDMDDAVDFNT